jgi:exopolysaccharide production protein ExoZ
VKKVDFLPRLESLRGVAALAVVGYHVSSQLSEGSFQGWLDALACRLVIALTNGTGAVVTFFVLSGFVLARSLEKNSDAVSFFRNRLFRLFPAAIVVVALLTALHWRFGFFIGHEPSFDAINVMLNLLMVRSDINGVMWSMTVECAATPLIFASAWLVRERGPWPLLILVAILFGLSFWGPYAHLLGGFANLAPLYAFVVGVLMHFRGARVAAINPNLANVMGLIAIAAFCFCGIKKQTAPVLMLECLSAATVIALIAWRPAMSLFNPLDLSVIRFYGRVSYSFYLLHPLGMLLAFRAINPTTLGGVPLSVTVVLTTLVSILFTTPAAWLSWRFIEAPAIRFGKNWGRREIAKGSAAVAQGVE